MIRRLFLEIRKGKFLFLWGLSLLLLAAWFWLRGGPPEDGTDWLLRLFAGHGTGYFFQMGLLFLLAIDILPLWALCSFLERVAGERSAFLTIRLTRRRELMRAILGTAFPWILLYGYFLVMAGAQNDFLTIKEDSYEYNYFIGTGE